MAEPSKELLHLPKQALAEYQRRPAAPECLAAHVSYDGDLKHAWLKVKGHLILMGECDDSQLETELGSIFILYGSMHKTRIKAGMNIYVKHAQEADLVAGHDIVIENSVKQSRLAAGQRILSEARAGAIQGGSCHAGELVDVHSLGSPAFQPTEIVLASETGGVRACQVFPEVVIAIGRIRQKVKRLLQADCPFWFFAQDRRIFVARGRLVADGRGGMLFMPTESRPLV